MSTRCLEVGALEGVSADLAGRRIVVLGGEDAAAGALVACLQNTGARAVAVPANVRLVPAGLIDQLGAINIVIDLNVGTADIGDAADAWPRQLARTLKLLRACAADWTAETDCRRLGYVPVTRTGGQLGAGSAPVSHPMGGLWVGLAKGLPREIPNCNVRVVNLVGEPLDPAELAELVVAELYRWGLFEIALRDGRRYTLQARRCQAGAPVRSFGPADTVVMSGGGRGIGFALALDFATRYGARVIVTGRALLPDPQDPVLTLDEAGFAAYRADRLRAGAANRQLVTVRAELAAEPAPGAELSARVEPDRLRGMFGIGAMPRPQVSLNVIENLVRASWTNQQPDSPRAFALARLTRLGPTPAGATVINNRAGDWSAVAEDHTSWLSGREARFI